jgi:hypothetical protein
MTAMDAVVDVVMKLDNSCSSSISSRSKCVRDIVYVYVCVREREG